MMDYGTVIVTGTGATHASILGSSIRFFSNGNSLMQWKVSLHRRGQPKIRFDAGEIGWPVMLDATDWIELRTTK
jgi:hypothetical protein